MTASRTIALSEPSWSAPFPPRPCSAHIWTRPAGSTGISSRSRRCGKPVEATDRCAEDRPASMGISWVTDARSPALASPLTRIRHGIPAATEPTPGSAGMPCFAALSPFLATIHLTHSQRSHDPHIAQSTVPSPRAGSIPPNPPPCGSTPANGAVGHRRTAAVTHQRHWQLPGTPHQKAIPITMFRTLRTTEGEPSLVSFNPEGARQDAQRASSGHLPDCFDDADRGSAAQSLAVIPD